jgi:hypothetical protein
MTKQEIITIAAWISGESKEKIEQAINEHEQETMRVIWKYTLNNDKLKTEFNIPKNSEILSFKEQGKELCIWTLVNPNAETEKRTFLLVETGSPILNYTKKRYNFIGTVSSTKWNLVYHLFERYE